MTTVSLMMGEKSCVQTEAGVVNVPIIRMSGGATRIIGEEFTTMAVIRGVTGADGIQDRITADITAEVARR
jgi:hypothetical protein